MTDYYAKIGELPIAPKPEKSGTDDFKAFWSRVVDLLERSPEAQQELNRIRSPKTHLGWNDHIYRALLCSGLTLPKALSEQILEKHAVTRTVYSVTAMAWKQHAPARYLNQDLAESLLNTELPKILEPPPPPLFPAMHLLWPTGLLISETNEPIDSLIVIPSEDLAKGLEAGGMLVNPSSRITQPGLVFAGFAANGECYAGTYLWDPANWKKAGNVSRTADEINLDPVGIDEVNAALQRLAVNSWLLLAYKLEGWGFLPGVPPSSGPATGQDAKGRRVPLAPVFIGPKFKTEVPKELQDQAQRRITGSHASPRKHWRRGHFHTVRHGENWSQTKTAWFKPTLVGD